MAQALMIDTLKGLMIIGYQKSGAGEFYSTDILQLKCQDDGNQDVGSACKWQKWDHHELPEERGGYVVLPLGDSFSHETCNTGKYVSYLYC